MKICTIENGATIKLKADLELQELKVEKQNRKEIRRQVAVESLAFDLFEKCTEMIEKRSRGTFTFNLYIYDSTIASAYPSKEFEPHSFEQKSEDIAAAYLIVKELLEKANYETFLHIYSHDWYHRSGKIGYIYFAALD